MTMRVVELAAPGPPEALTLVERPVPEPLPTEVRVRVAAAGVNPIDWKTRKGLGLLWRIGTPPFVLGWDVAGVVDAVGLGVNRFAVGDRVFGMPRFPHQAGAYAEHVTAPSRQLARTPSALDDLHAGALPLAGLTAWQSLVDVADVQPGQRVLVQAAAGGVGHLAVQIAKARGATVIGTASAAKHDFLAGLGIDEAIDHRTTDYRTAVRDIDLVLDLLGGDDAFGAIGCVRRGGLVISVPSNLPVGIVEAGTERGVTVKGVLVEPDQVGLEQLAAMVDAGTLVVAVDEVFDLADAAAAHTYGERGRSTGKIVLDCRSRTQL